ncbi:MAG: hypothetical protein E7604_05650 [Ruminococcaceae bacterium]|nr:hypothetical protein [Oscillospiraceae bacterium]
MNAVRKLSLALIREAFSCDFRLKIGKFGSLRDPGLPQVFNLQQPLVIGGKTTGAKHGFPAGVRYEKGKKPVKNPISHTNCTIFFGKKQGCRELLGVCRDLLEVKQSHYLQ